MVDGSPRPRPRVVHLERQPFPGQFSIERVFATVRPRLAGSYDVERVVSSHPSKGLLPRLRAALEARRRQGELTHVLGDVTYLALLLRRASTVLTVHDTEFLTRGSAPKRLLYRWLWLQLPVWRAAAVTVPSEAARRDLLATVRCEPGRVRVVPNPVLDAFVPDPRPAPAGPAVVLLVGTLPNKNLPRAAAALAGLDVRLVVLGHLDDAQRQSLNRTGLPVDNRVDLSDDDVVAAYRGCDLLLFVSTHEGFGMPVLEAQAVGRPVVTSDRPPMRDVAGGAAELVDPEDVASIRAGVRRVLDDAAHRDHLVAAGLRNVERFRPAAVAAGYAAVYAEVLAGGAGAQRGSGASRA